MTATTSDLLTTGHGPTYWFVTLDSALEDGDWETAAQAADELRRIGIDVRIRLRSQPDRPTPHKGDLAGDRPTEVARA
jgi:hypothetical protein